jgi:hypothetical protein
MSSPSKFGADRNIRAGTLLLLSNEQKVYIWKFYCTSLHAVCRSPVAQLMLQTDSKFRNKVQQVGCNVDYWTVGTGLVDHEIDK